MCDVYRLLMSHIGLFCTYKQDAISSHNPRTKGECIRRRRSLLCVSFDMSWF